jgi:hypothetical protein
MPEYDMITPTQWVLFLWVALIAFTILWWLFWNAGRTEPLERDDAGPVEIERACGTQCSIGDQPLWQVPIP